MTSRARNIRYAGLLLGLGLTVLVGFLMPDELAIAARVTAAVVVLMGTWWVTEAVPLPVTAMVPLIAFPATQVSPLDEVAGSYASEIIFLLLGGFLLARGIQRWNLHRRIAILIVLVVGTKLSRMILGLMMATVALGMWVSNTAIAMMMIPLGSSLVALVPEEAGGDDVGGRQFRPLTIRYWADDFDCLCRHVQCLWFHHRLTRQYLRGGIPAGNGR